jgi:hypothetical protein
MSKILSFIQSPRFLSFIGHCGAIAGVDVLNYVAANLNIFNMPQPVVLVVGLALAQVIGALKAFSNGQPMGFVK